MRTLSRAARAAVAVAAIVAGLGLTACGEEHVAGSLSASNPTIATTRSGPQFVDDFNYLTLTNHNTSEPNQSLFYENLIKLSPSTGYTPQPWLATSWTWSDGGRTLTWHLRHGVRWNNGTPMTSADVAFSILLTNNKQLFSYGITGGKVISVATPNQWTAIVHYSVPSYSGIVGYYETPIYPKAIWGKVNPGTYLNLHPVGTGPYMLSSFGQQQIVLKRNPYYWQSFGQAPQTITYVAESSDAGVLQDLLSGRADFEDSSPLVGDPATTFVKRDPKYNHFWNQIPGATAAIQLNCEVQPTSNVDIRQALYWAVDGPDLVKLTPGNFPIVGNISGANPPTYTQWTAPQYRGVTQKQNIPLARQYLKRSGYTVKDGKLTKDGKSYPLSYTTDPQYDPVSWEYGLPAMIKDALGITVTVNSSEANANAVQDGQFTLGFGNDTPRQSALAGLSWDVGAGKMPPVGTAAPADWSRCYSPQAQKLSAEMAATDDTAKQQQLGYQIQRILVDQRFDIPVAAYTFPVAWTTRKWIGWPTASYNPYHNIAAQEEADLEGMILHLRPAKG